MLCEIVTSQAAKKRVFDLEELILDSWRGSQLSPEDKLLLESFPQLHILSFIGCGLSNLQNFPELPRLTKLVLTHNNISTGLVGLRELCNLTQLNLSYNPIRYLPDLRPLVLPTQTKLTSLISLDLSHCPVETCQFFRDKMFVMLPFLEILDGMNKRGQAAEMTDDDDSEEDLPESLLEARKRVFEQRPAEKPKSTEVIEIEDSDTEQDAEGSGDSDEYYDSDSDSDSPPPAVRAKTTQ